MKITHQELRQTGILNLQCGKEMIIPACFAHQIGLLYDNGQELTAIIGARSFHDYAIYRHILCLLNQLYRYYRKPVTIYCLSYQALASQECCYLSFSKRNDSKKD